MTIHRDAQRRYFCFMFVGIIVLSLFQRVEPLQASKTIDIKTVVQTAKPTKCPSEWQVSPWDICDPAIREYVIADEGGAYRRDDTSIYERSFTTPNARMKVHWRFEDPGHRELAGSHLKIFKSNEEEHFVDAIFCPDRINCLIYRWGGQSSSGSGEFDADPNTTYRLELNLEEWTNSNNDLLHKDWVVTGWVEYIHSGEQMDPNDDVCDSDQFQWNVPIAIEGRTEFANDEDWSTIYVPSKGNLNVTLNWVGNNSYDIYLFDRCGADAPMEKDEGGGGITRDFSTWITSPGTYQLQVKNTVLSETAKSQYELIVGLDLDDNGFESAQLFNLPYTGFLDYKGDNDWQIITVAESDVPAKLILSTATDKNYDLELTSNGNDTVLLSSNKPRGQDDEVIIQRAGTYRVHVKGDTAEDYGRSYSVTLRHLFAPPSHLISPPDQSHVTISTLQEVVQRTPFFLWDGYAPRYELQWDTDNAFTHPITVEVGTMEYSSPTLASKITAGQYFWRVRGMDDYGPATDWSNTNTFTVLANQPATKTWAGTFQVSYMWAAMNGGGEDGSGSPYNSDLPNLQRTYCGKETAPWGIRNLEPGIYEARIITGTQSGYANSACTDSSLVESSAIENFWPWVINHNPMALKPGTGFNGGSLTAFGNLAGNPNPGWMSMADIWVGQSESDGTRYHIERPPNNPDSPSSSTIFPLMQSETVWFYLNDWIMSDNLGGSTIELSRIGDLPAGVTTTVYNLSPNLYGNDVLLDHFDSITSVAGAINGSVVITQGILNLGQAAQLQHGGYIQYAIPGWYTLETTPTGTVEMWVRPQAYGELLYLTDGDVKDPTGLNHYMRLELDQATGRLRYAVLTDTVESTSETNATLPLNTWSHIAVTWSSNGTKLYINGRLANDNWADLNLYPLLSAQNYLYLNGWGTGNFAGQIDELHISKVVLGADEFWYHATGVRDKFDLPDGPINQGWFGPEGFGGYSIRSGRAKLFGGGPLYWHNSRQGDDQEASIQFVKVMTNAYQQSVLLKVQGEPPYWVNGAIAVFYDARNANGPAIRIETRLPPTLDAWEWKRYENKPLVIHDGDTLRGRVTSTGMVYVYLNDALVLTQPLDEADKAFFNGKGGYIGLEMIDAAGALLDNFGGGTITPATPPPPAEMNDANLQEFVIEELETPTMHAYLPLVIK